jgi:hypothetical protein
VEVVLAMDVVSYLHDTASGGAVRRNCCAGSVRGGGREEHED